MSQLIENSAELTNFFHKYKSLTPLQKKSYDRGVMVSSSVRKEFLTSVEQGRVICDGTSIEIKFKNLGGGVWLAYVERPHNK